MVDVCDDEDQKQQQRTSDGIDIYSVSFPQTT